MLDVAANPSYTASFVADLRSIGLSPKPKILFIGEDSDRAATLLAELGEIFQVVQVTDTAAASARLGEGDFYGVFCTGASTPLGLQQECPAWTARILEDLPDGIVMVDEENVISWSNARFKTLCGHDDPKGNNFYSVLGSPEILGPDFCPFHTALATGEPSTTKLRVEDKGFYQLHVSPVRGNPELASGNLVVVVRDVTGEMQQQQKLEAIHLAGIELTDLKPDEVCEMSVEERIDLLTSNILHHTQDLLNFDVVEIRLLEQNTGQLVPLLAEGISADAAGRSLFARPQGYGVTGFVAATGKSYLCEDTLEDPLYLQSFEGARSSLTVPLMLHDEVIGTFNVEHSEPRAFSENDLLFLEIYARDVAVALNTLDLLAVQGADLVQRSIEAIHRAVALPIDKILNDTVHVIESYIGHDPAIVEELKEILRNSREIKELIQEVGQQMTPAEAVPAGVLPSQQRRFQNVRILVVDGDEQVLNDAHVILEKHGCTVETARTGTQAVFLVRSCPADSAYQVIISDVKLPDMTGHNLFVQLKELMNQVPPLVLMQAFGHDPGHSIVKARQEGLHKKAVLYKPFLVDQLLEVIDTILHWQRD
jgi:CheY-like chemotaxis protein/PAS domain-containing protein